ncbi:unnamed protein product [Cladocopium goreaui]|uniref:Uncharacterized protein n=1 Tax=Cladocopium goreaui TaxID=2562237 RepID=A0A9P1D4K4_9DINO|nr:unnamed protein product [Cladocopium goreaui]
MSWNCVVEVVVRSLLAPLVLSNLVIDCGVRGRGLMVHAGVCRGLVFNLFRMIVDHTFRGVGAVILDPRHSGLWPTADTRGGQKKGLIRQHECRTCGPSLSGEEANLRQAWSVSDEQGPSFGEGEDLAESLLPLLARLSSKERDALLSKMADLQRQVQAGDVSRKLEEICRQLGLECRGLKNRTSTAIIGGAAESRLLNSQKNPETDFEAIAAAQKRMACLEEQLELQREGLQRQRRKSVQAPVVLAGHSLLHGSLLKAASKEHDQCRAECDRLQAEQGLR